METEIKITKSLTTESVPAIVEFLQPFYDASNKRNYSGQDINPEMFNIPLNSELNFKIGFGDYSIRVRFEIKRYSHARKYRQVYFVDISYTNSGLYTDSDTMAKLGEFFHPTLFEPFRQSEK